jgi:cobalt-zinc-cadmium efflux system outer membrane protein
VRTDFVVERGGKRDRRIAVAEQSRSVAELSVLDTTRRLILDVEQAVLDVLAAKATLALAEQNLDSLNSVVELNVLRVRAGDLADVELVRTRLAALQYRNQVLQRRSEQRVARTRLQLLLGRSSVSPLVDVTGDLRRELLPLSLSELESRALTLRPDISGLRAEQVRTQYDLQLALATGKADFVFGTEYRRQQGLAGKSNSLGLFFSVPLPVFDRNQGEIARVEREQQQIQAQIRALEAEILNEVRTAYEQYTTSRELLESIEGDLLTRARDVREITDYSYRRGEASLLEFLDAQRAFNETMDTYYEARAGYARSLYTIESITGKVQP